MPFKASNATSESSEWRVRTREDVDGSMSAGRRGGGGRGSGRGEGGEMVGWEGGRPR